MAFTQSEINALKAALASGITTVSYGGRTVTYRSVAEIERIIAKAEAEVSSTGRQSVSLAKFNRDC